MPDGDTITVDGVTFKRGQVRDPKLCPVLGDCWCSGKCLRDETDAEFEARARRGVHLRPFLAAWTLEDPGA